MTMTFRPIDRILWDASIDAPEFSKLIPGLDMRAGLPSAASITPFDDAEAVRPYRHLRAFYLKRADGVVAVKGSEIMAADVDVHLGALADYRIEFPGRGRSLFSALEHFPLNEQKIPLALSLDEAMEDVRSAAAVQKVHLARFGTRAHVPLPLYAVRWPDSVAEAHLGRLNKLLSARARRTVERVAADGLGAVVYHYPCAPLRVAHLPELVRDRAEAGWLARLSAICDPTAALDGWLDLLARLLVLGFLPGSIESIGVGHCLEMKNAVIDGGLVDMGSVCRVEDVSDPRQFSETLLAALADLAKTCRQFLGGNAPDVEAEYRNPSLAMVLMLHRLLPDLAKRVDQLGGGDPRITDFFRSASAADSLPSELQRLSAGGAIGGGHG
jgi:hypothetical protein